jgi:hypothetical protein
VSKQYKKACNNCGTEILLSMSDSSSKWTAFELDGQNFHRCKQQPQQQTTPPKTVENGHIDVDTTTTKDDEIIALKNRVASIESWIKKISESWVMNQS